VDGGVEEAGAQDAPVGILGGTFDPPHAGHLLLAQTALEQLGLERVLLVPAGQPVHKVDETVSEAHHRVTMTRLAAASNPAFLVDTADVERPEPHTTTTLLPLLRARYPGRQLWLLLGGDSLRDFAAWYRPQEIIAQARLAVLARPDAIVSWPELEAAVPGVRDAVTWLDGPSVAVSSTQIRRWSAAGRTLRYVVPDAVCAYIDRTGLYHSF
jgi:nicotinate-nucleotide adenylyltransferase